jgi:hypothetical protein
MFINMAVDTLVALLGEPKAMTSAEPTVLSSEVSVGENGGTDIYDINGKGGVAWVGNGARSFITAFMTREGDPKQRASIGPLSCIAISNGNISLS